LKHTLICGESLLNEYQAKLVRSINQVSNQFNSGSMGHNYEEDRLKKTDHKREDDKLK